MKRIILLLLMLLPLGGCVDLGELQVRSDAMLVRAEAWQDQFDELGGDLQDLQAEYEMLAVSGQAGSEYAEAIVARMEDVISKQETIGGWINTAVETHRQINVGIQNAEDGWGLLEVGMTVAGSFFPPVLIAQQLLRISRKRLTGVIEAVADGGGPVNPQATSRAMDPKLKAFVTAIRRKIGDKADRSAT